MEYKIKCIEKDDEDLFLLHLKGPDMYHAVWNILQKMRDQWKYEEDPCGTWFEAYELVYDTLFESGINIDQDYK